MDMRPLNRASLFNVSTFAVCTVIGITALCTASDAQTVFQDQFFSVKVTSNVVYDGVNGLTLDVYEPIGAGVPSVKPAMVLAHAGAWVAGSKDSSTFENPSQTGDFNTPMHEYARKFAKRGYVCVSINYRKLDDGLPIPGTGSLGAGTWTTLTAGLNALLGTSLSEAQVVAELETASLDTVNAINWLVTNAGPLGVDTSRIAVGGYSAGAFNALFAAFVDSAPVAAVWTNSGSLGEGGNAALYIDAAEQIPTISFHGTLDSILAFSPFGDTLRDELIAKGIPHEYYAMTGEDHYYLRGDTVTDAADRAVPDTIENLVSDFMFTNMNLAALGAVAPPLPAATIWSIALAAGLLVLLALLWLHRRHDTDES